jgi:hypothetical protein
MSLFEKSSADDEAEVLFPTEPAFLIPVEVRDTPQYGPGHKGVFCLTFIQKGVKFWQWTDRVTRIHHLDLPAYIKRHFSNQDDEIRLFLRQGFVLPGPDVDDYFCSNPTDAGRFMNHSNDPNCGPDGTLCEIHAGDELTMDYGFHGNPKWYRDICKQYGVDTEEEIAGKSRK